MTWKRSDSSRRSSWTKADIRRARQTPLAPVLEALGYQLEPRQNGNYRILGLAEEIILKDHYWVCTEDGSAGNSIDFLVKIKGVDFNRAMELLSGADQPNRS